MKTLLAVVVCYFTFLSISHADPQRFSSGDKQVNVIELYTSEGCSSCPPSDQWLSSLKDDPRLWKEIIPLAFHVDYWDYIGWKDRFADPKFADRQRYYALSDHVSGVYTPGFMLNGREWRGKKPIDSNNELAGELSVELDGEEVKVSFLSKHKQALLTINIAVLGFDLVTEVQRGENRGRELGHDFVVLGYQYARLQQHKPNHYTLSTQLPKLKQQANKLAIVAWVNQAKDLTPLQATGGWMVSN